jgi:myosin protein heavy chain
MQSQIERKDRQASQATEDANRQRDKVDKLLKTIDELQASESNTQLSARRAERELREEKEKILKLERELEGWKHLRTDKGGVASGLRFGTPGLDGGSVRRLSGWRGSIDGVLDDASSPGGGGIEIPKRKSSLSRAPSLTKGFL